MTERPVGTVETTPAEAKRNRRLAVLLAMAMFVLVVDTSIMNVSITAVASDLGTTVNTIQSAIALEALVSAAFILINSKLGDIIGRRRAYVLGLLAYAIGALAMTLTQSVTTIVIFWAIIGGLGASLLLPAMQSLIHGNFQGAAQKKTYALVGAAAAVGAAIGPLLGGFVTTYLSWRVGFLLEVVVIAIVLFNIKLVLDVPFTGVRKIDVGGAVLSVLGMGGVVLGILVWQEGGAYVGLLIAIGAVALAALAFWLVRRKRAGKVVLLDPDLFKIKNFRVGAAGDGPPADHAGRGDDRPAAVPPGDARVRRDAGRPVARPALAHHVRRRAGRREVRQGPPGRQHHPGRVRARARRHGAGHPGDPSRRVRLGPARPAADRRRRARPAGLAAQQLHPRADRGGAGQRGSRGQLGRPVLRAVVRSGARRWDPARHPLVRLHQHDRGQRRHPAGRPGADRRRARGQRPTREHHPARGAARRPARGDPGGDHPASTPTPATGPSRWRCSSRCSPACSGSSTRSA